MSTQQFVLITNDADPLHPGDGVEALGLFDSERAAWEHASAVEYAAAGEPLEPFDYPHEIGVLMDCGYVVLPLPEPTSPNQAGGDAAESVSAGPSGSQNIDVVSDPSAERIGA